MRSASCASNQESKPASTGKVLLILGFASLISMGAYLLVSGVHLRIGFPLDDAWIHQTYARNLARLGEWSFIPGQPSGGSTSPLWSLLLSGGYLLGLAPFAWTFLLGFLLLTGMGFLAEKSVAALVPAYPGRIPWVGLVLVFEWHFIWAAASGMETLLHAVLVLLAACLLWRRSPPWLMLGSLAGLSLWVRPDGVTLLGPILLTAVLVEKGWRRKAGALVLSLAGFGLLLIPYLLFQYSLTGEPLPTTFYAKQAEYVEWQARSAGSRLGESLVTLLTGAVIILVPGVVCQVVKSLRARAWAPVAMFIWLAGYLGIYALRLPPYQHARYLMPAMPVLFLLGLGGFLGFMLAQKGQGKTRNLARFSWSTLLFLTSAGFYLLGMRSYVNDVTFIETEMVDTARWVAENLPAQAVIAAHDIGALGYFDDHELVDLAGLVTPQVIPFLRDEARLAEYMDAEQVDYLVVFPDWYPTLTRALEPVFSTGAAYARSIGETNMAVFPWGSR